MFEGGCVIPFFGGDCEDTALGLWKQGLSVSSFCRFTVNIDNIRTKRAELFYRHLRITSSCDSSCPLGTEAHSVLGSMPEEAIRDTRPPFEITEPQLPVEAERLFLSRFKELSA